MIIKEPFAELSYDPAVPCLTAQWKAYARSHEFRNFLNQGAIEYHKRKSPQVNCGWLADTRNIGVVSKDDMDWLDREWNKQMYDLGLRHMALIVPESVFGGMTVKNYTQNTENSAAGITTQVFEDIALAKRWLREWRPVKVGV